jgi:excinuclease ABC subunit B
VNLVDFGFRLPAAMDNRPLKFEEFFQVVNQAVYVSATPAPFEIEESEGVLVEQLIRPTGLLDPQILIRPLANQVDDLIEEIDNRIKMKDRVLVTTLTKRMAEELTKYLMRLGVKVDYIHSEVKTLDRVEILRNLRMGVIDVLIGVNLLREGLDLPEVSLVAILDADKEGFLRAERSLIQTIGRAARHVEGVALLYADNLTDSMVKAISETERRRAIQHAYNVKHGITPTPAGKRSGNSILSSLEVTRRLSDDQLEQATKQAIDDSGDYQVPLDSLPELITQLEEKMKVAAKNLEFEEAANLRDRIKKLRQKLVRRT